MLEHMAGQRGASSEKGTKRLTLGGQFWGPFLRPDFESVFGRLLSWILEGLGGVFLGHFFCFLGHFGDAAAEVENVVWIYYLLQIKHMGICQHRQKKS